MPESRATAYAQSVLDGQVVAGEFVRAACLRHMSDLRRSDLLWDQEEEDRLHEWFPMCCEFLEPADLAGQRIELSPHQSFFYGSLRAWRKQEFGIWRHRFRRAILMSGRGGAGKTASIPGFILYYLVCLNAEDPMPETYVASELHPQSYGLMDALWQQVARNEELVGLFSRQLAQGHPHTLTLNDNPDESLTLATVRRVGLSSKSGEAVRGPKPSLVVIEEGQSAQSYGVITELLYGAKNRPWPLVLTLCNAGTDKATPVGQQYDEAVEGFRGQAEMDDDFFPLLYVSDEGEEILDLPDEQIEHELKKANPLWPISPRPAFVWPEIRKGQQQPSKRVEVLNHFFGVWTATTTSWLSAQAYTACEKDRLEIPEDARLFIGLDLSQRWDMTALALYYDWSGGGAVRGYCWLPEGTMADRPKDDQILFRQWADEGWLSLTPSNRIQYSAIVQRMAPLLGGAHEVMGVATDAFKMGDFQEALGEEGVEWTTDWEARKPGILYLVVHNQKETAGVPLARWNETPPDEREGIHAPLWMPRSIDVMEERILAERVQLEKNPLLRWAFQSVELKYDQSKLNRTFVRAPAKGGKIDLAVAATMASGLADAWVGEPKKDWDMMEWVANMRKSRAAREGGGD